MTTAMAYRNITLGTAGHIDHGKTALIRLLTGCETDRLKEEKERGMSIELGFAPCQIAGTEIGIVDVPGHENFIKTMVAGASGIDGGLLVVAADDGVMPQTREHLDILTLLGVEHGMVALTKIDCVSPERVEDATQEVKAYLVGTFLENAPVLPVSSITGQGFEGFYEALKTLVASIPPKQADGVFRVPVERAFSAKGYGTIVAGVPAAGSVQIGDEVVLLPQGTKGRLRAIQVYGHESDQALVGQCAALNVPQWDPKLISRGNVVTLGGYFAPEQWYLCDLRLLDHERNELKNGAQVKFHTGTSETVASVYLFQDASLKGGQGCLVQLRLSDPVVAGPGDRFILRVPSPARTIGGGIVVEALAKRLKRTHPGVIEDIQARARAVRSPHDFVAYCIQSAESGAVDEKSLALRSKIPSVRLAAILAELARAGRIETLGIKRYIHNETANRIEVKLIELIADFHRRKPESPGLSREQLLTASGLDRDVLDQVVERMTTQGKLAQRKGCLALPDHREKFQDGEQRLLARIESLYRDHPFDPPDATGIMETLGGNAKEIERALRILTEQQRLVRIDQKLLFHVDAIAEARARLIAHFQENEQLESVAFKYLLDTTRKYAIPLLDYFDKIQVTRRVGNTRFLHPACKRS